MDEVDWLRNKLERLETSISAMARTAGSVGPEGGSGGAGPQPPAQPGQQPKEYMYEKWGFRQHHVTLHIVQQVIFGDICDAICSVTLLHMSAQLDCINNYVCVEQVLQYKC